MSRKQLTETLQRQTLYHDLEDHTSVENYPEVQGVSTPLYFFNHDHPESGGDEFENKSKSNVFEVQMIAGFVTYLLRQGYTDNRITIITPVPVVVVSCPAYSS